MTLKTKRSIQWIKENGIRKYAGIHLIADFWNGENIDNSPRKLKEILSAAARAANSTPLKVSIHKFSPQGITGVVLLAESHLAIHAWPELRYVAIDVFTCGDKSMPYKALDYLKAVIKPERVEVREAKRGEYYE